MSPLPAIQAGEGEERDDEEEDDAGEDAPDDECEHGDPLLWLVVPARPAPRRGRAGSHQFCGLEVVDRGVGVRREHLALVLASVAKLP